MVMARSERKVRRATAKAVGRLEYGERDLEFYETPDPFTRFLFRYMAHRRTPIVGRIYEPCVGDGAIIRAAALRPQEFGVANSWVTNDLDTRWPADMHADAADHSPQSIWRGISVDWTVSNPPFSSALDIAEEAIKASKVGVALHLRISIHEVLKTGPRRSWMKEHLPTGLLFLPRFAYQRSPSTGEWTQDTVCACWCIWLQGDQDRPDDPTYQRGRRPEQFIDYAPESVVDELKVYTPAYRERMDALMLKLAMNPRREVPGANPSSE